MVASRKRRRTRRRAAPAAGDSCLHGSHQSAQKSITTGTVWERSTTSATNVASVTARTGAPCPPDGAPPAAAPSGPAGPRPGGGGAPGQGAQIDGSTQVERRARGPAGLVAHVFTLAHACGALARDVPASEEVPGEGMQAQEPIADTSPFAAATNLTCPFPAGGTWKASSSTEVR